MANLNPNYRPNHLKIYDYISSLSGGKQPITVYMTEDQVRAFRANFTMHEWQSLRRASNGDGDRRNVALYDNVLIRLKTVEHGQPREVDITEGLPK